jgi:hypothetical protein
VTEILKEIQCSGFGKEGQCNDGTLISHTEPQMKAAQAHERLSLYPSGRIVEVVAHPSKLSVHEVKAAASIR